MIIKNIMSQEENKDLANLYFDLYSGCIKYKEKNIKKKEINCEKYYDSYIIYLSRLNHDSYINHLSSQLNKNNKNN